MLISELNHERCVVMVTHMLCLTGGLRLGYAWFEVFNAVLEASRVYIGLEIGLQRSCFLSLRNVPSPYLTIS